MIDFWNTSDGQLIKQEFQSPTGPQYPEDYLIPGTINGNTALVDIDDNVAIRKEVTIIDMDSDHTKKEVIVVRQLGMYESFEPGGEIDPELQDALESL